MVTEAQQPDRSGEAEPPARDAGRSGRRSPGRWALEWLKSLAVAFLLFLLIRTFAVEAFRIPTGSMERTLMVGDFLLVNKAAYGAQVPGTTLRLPAFATPTWGDVVVFTPPHEPGRHYVKRLLGAPGDTLQMRDKVLFRNGWPVPEPYVQHEDEPDVHAVVMDWQIAYALEGADSRPTRDNWGPIVVPAGQYFVLGDNRDDSEDSRYWGFVPEEALKGKPLFVYYSFDPAALRPAPWLTGIRWGRIGGVIY